VNITIKRHACTRADSGESLDTIVYVYEVTVANNGAVWVETFASRCRVIDFMNGVRAGASLLSTHVDVPEVP